MNYSKNFQKHLTIFPDDASKQLSAEIQDYCFLCADYEVSVVNKVLGRNLDFVYDLNSMENILEQNRETLSKEFGFFVFR